MFPEMVLKLEELGSWFYKSKLSVNTSKTEVIFFGKSNKVEQCKNETAISFQKVLESKDKVKYLGVIFEKDMSWNKQVNEIRKKAYFSLHKVRKLSPLLNEECKKI